MCSDYYAYGIFKLFLQIQIFSIVVKYFIYFLILF